MESLQAAGRWFKRKQYQLEVTFGVYMFTPIEKDVFCTDPSSPSYPPSSLATPDFHP